jgi:hypothetical protein
VNISRIVFKIIDWKWQTAGLGTSDANGFTQNSALISTRKIMCELDRASECQVEQTEDDNRYLVQYAKRPGAVYHVEYNADLDRLCCDCRLVEHGGIPWSHLIAVPQFTGEAFRQSLHSPTMGQGFIGYGWIRFRIVLWRIDGGRKPS